MDSELLILDCTLRDGGHALEEMSYRNDENKFFDLDNKKVIIKNLINSNIDIIELGSIADGNIVRDEFSVYQGVLDAYQAYEPITKDPRKCSLIYRDPHIYNLDLPKWEDGFPIIARVIIRYSELEKSYNFCRNLSSKGYKVFIQPMATMQYSLSELKQLTSLANNINAGALYIVDTYGAMFPENIEKIFRYFDKFLNSDIRIGFHAHDNLNLAYSNSLEFISINTKRKKILDSTLYGIGLGAGNCRSELICSFLKENYKKDYQIKPLLEACEVIENLRGKDESWGVGLINTLSALENVATKYVSNLRYVYKKSYGEIYDLIKKIPNEYRQQYSKENMKNLSKLYLK